MASQHILLDLARPLSHAVFSGQSIHDAVDRMRETHGEAVLVVDELGDIRGVVSMHDVMLLFEGGVDFDQTLDQLELSGLASVSDETTPEEALRVMAKVSHDGLLICHEERVCGLVTMCDVVQYIIRDKDATIRDLILYITR